MINLLAFLKVGREEYQNLAENGDRSERLVKRCRRHGPKQRATGTEGPIIRYGSRFDCQEICT
jgi:hypothetical protein